MMGDEFKDETRAIEHHETPRSSSLNRQSQPATRQKSEGRSFMPIYLIVAVVIVLLLGLIFML